MRRRAAIALARRVAVQLIEQRAQIGCSGARGSSGRGRGRLERSGQAFKLRADFERGFGRQQRAGKFLGQKLGQGRLGNSASQPFGSLVCAWQNLLSRAA